MNMDAGKLMTSDGRRGYSKAELLALCVESGVNCAKSWIKPKIAGCLLKALHEAGLLELRASATGSVAVAVGCCSLNTDGKICRNKGKYSIDEKQYCHVHAKAANKGAAIVGAQTNEAFGVAVELAICRLAGIDEKNVDPDRAAPYDPDDSVLAACLRNTFGDLLDELEEYIGPSNNALGDFRLRSGKYLSIKSHQLRGGKVCPNRSGQPSVTRWLEIFSIQYAPNATADQISGIRATMRGQTAELLKIYCSDLFKTEYSLLVRVEVDGYSAQLVDRQQPYDFEQKHITFSNEIVEFKSLSVRYKGRSLGEFQLHSNRSSPKFRFKTSVILDLLRL